jgi:hypothetical protein
LGRLNGSDGSGSKREGLDALRQHAAGHDDPQDVTALFLLDRPFQATNRFQDDPRVSRVGAHAYLRNRRVLRTDPYDSLFRFPLHRVLTVPLGQHHGQQLQRSQEAAAQ